MGGLTGLPRIPPRALRLTHKWNPGCEYSEVIATLWRDLCTLYGWEDVPGLGGDEKASRGRTGRFYDTGVKTGKTRGFTRLADSREELVLSIVSRHPSLLNPDESNRFVFGRSKAVLTEMLGSQDAALAMMRKNPTVLQQGDALLDATPATLRAQTATAQLRSAAPGLAVLAALTAALAQSGALEGVNLEPASLADALAAAVSAAVDQVQRL